MLTVTPDRKPWWQTTHTPRQGFVLGGLWLLLGAHWTVTAIMRPGFEALALAVLSVAGSAAYLISAVRLRRLQRAADDPPGSR